MNFDNPWTILLIAVAVTIVVLFIVYNVLPTLIQKGYPIDNILKRANDALQEAQTILDVVDKPGANGQISKGTKILSLIVDLAREGVSAAEQLYMVSKLEDSQRKDYSAEYVKNSLKSVGINVTPELEKVIDGTIESSVRALGYSSKGASFLLGQGIASINPIENETPEDEAEHKK